MNALPTLYGLDTRGNIKEWNVEVRAASEASTVCITYGLVGGKRTTSTLTLTRGKNEGKRNATTHFEQAVATAKSKWEHKRNRDGYVTDPGLLVKRAPEPMLAHDYAKHRGKIVFPCYVQPKLDGFRMLYDAESDKMVSRTGKEFVALRESELHRELRSLCAGLDVVLDGELYVHDPAFVFEQYGVLRKSKALTASERNTLNVIQYHVYDIVDETCAFQNRHARLVALLDAHESLLVQPVSTYECQSDEFLQTRHDAHVQGGYEGSMVRNANGMYRCKYRSTDLLKYKNFDDAEFSIVGCACESDTTGHDIRPVIWVCETVDGKRFNVQSKGTREERDWLYRNGDQFVGKKLSVKFFGYTADGVPRFPKTLREGRASIREEL